MTDTDQTAVFPEIGAPAATRAVHEPKVLRPRHWLVLSVWCGLVAGLMEVAAIVARKSFVDLNQFYWMSRHFVWLIPLTNVGIFLAVGVVLALLGTLWAARVPLPDVYVADRGDMVAVRGAAGKLAVMRLQNSDAFSVKEWLAADADERTPKDKSLNDGAACDEIPNAYHRDRRAIRTRQHSAQTPDGIPSRPDR